VSSMVTEVAGERGDPPTTGSKLTRSLGAASLVSMAALLLFGLVLSPDDVNQGDAVRLFYLHVPVATIAIYVAFAITLVGSVIHLVKRSKFWDLVAGASGEIGVLFCGLTLITGMLWGKPTWGVYWQWDPRLTSTAVLFIMYLGYLVVRRLDLDPEVRSRRAAVVGIVSFFNVLIVRFSVDWWRSLHQTSTFTRLDGPAIEGLMLFSFFLGLVTMGLVFLWLLIHRFRVAWLEEQLAEQGLDLALTERRAEARIAGPGEGPL
jgi:heme exporter protein C